MGQRSLEGYQKKNERRKQRSAEAQSLAADVGQIPPVVNPARRESCRLDLLAFLVAYFPNSTGLKPFSDDHKRAIHRLQTCILEGGRFVEAMYRGAAKTTIGENAVMWATLYGHRRFVPIFGADADAASGNIDSIKTELSENELLYEDFPEVCHPIQKLEGKVQRCASQTCGGELTHIEWTADTIVLPTVRVPEGFERGAEGGEDAPMVTSPAAGAIITANGIMAASRGMKHKRPDGTQQRPDFVFLDDPQTDDSASTALQVTKRLNVIKKSILKLGGHGRQIAVFMAATVIREDDLADQLLDPKRNPAWQGERIPMVRQWADAHDSLWMQEYARIRNDYDPDVVGDQQRAHRDATAFYTRNREAMDAGCQVSWEHCYNDAEVSAIQHAYNALIDDGPEVFASEFQNRPIKPKSDDDEFQPAKAAELAARVNGLPRGIVPLAAKHLTAYVDVQGSLLYWMVVAWGEDFTGAVIDYGSYPDQGLPTFALRDAKKTLLKATKAGTREGAIAAGLDHLIGELVGREWRREDGVITRIGRLLVDKGYEAKIVHQVCRRTVHAAVVMPAKGKGIGPAERPMEDYTKKPGETIGSDWMITATGNRIDRFVLIDTNTWKTFVHSRLKVPPMDRHAITFYGREPRAHQMLADHLTAESVTRTEGRGRTVHLWRAKPGKPDNHLFDCLVGSAVAASMVGVSMVGANYERERARKRFDPKAAARRTVTADDFRRRKGAA